MLTEECLAHFQYVRAAKLAVYQQGEVELLHGSLKIRGRKSQINTVTMEPQCWRKSNPVVCSGRQMVFKHSNTPTHTDTHTCSLRWDVTSGPTKKFTTVEFYSEDSSLVINVLWLLCV